MNLGYDKVKGMVKNDDIDVCSRLSEKNNNDDYADRDCDDDAAVAVAAHYNDDGHDDDDYSHGWFRRVTTLLFV